ncbi:unnamed protein product, partial [Prorocentrum cordatum]
AAPPLASLPLARGRPSPSRGPPQGPVRPLAGPAPIGGPRASSALPTDGRRGCVPHGPAPERRNGRSPRSECVRPVRRAGAGGRRDLHARRRGLAPHGPAPERRHGRRDLHARRRGSVPHGPAPERRHGRGLRPECGRPVRRAGAGGRRDLHARRRGDGTVAACGQNADGQCDVPALEGGVTYTARLFGVKLLLQASFDGVSLRFLTLGGVERCRLLVAPGALLADVHHQLLDENAAGRLGPGFDRVDAVLPDRLLLSEASVDETVASVFGPARGG